jgi:hypothetical protein
MASINILMVVLFVIEITGSLRRNAIHTNLHENYLVDTKLILR